jgi:hypothetical protein
MNIRLNSTQTLAAVLGKPRVAVEVNGLVQTFQPVIENGEAYITHKGTRYPLHGLKLDTGGIAFFVEGARGRS